MRRLFAALLLVVGLVVATTAEPAQAAGKPGKATDTTYNVSGTYLMSGTVYLNPVKGTECLNVGVYIGKGGPAVDKAQGALLIDISTQVTTHAQTCTNFTTWGWSFDQSVLTTGTAPNFAYGDTDVYVTVITWNQDGRTVSMFTEGPYTYSQTYG